nr:uncharacterized protein LOC109751902 isoform X2 [Aegilops tauschii subsp. strangulata]
MAAAAAAARLSSSSHLMDEGVGSRSSRSGRRLPPEFGRDLAVLMILKFMLLCGYKNMAVNNSYAFQRLQMPQGLPNKGSLKRNGLTKKGRSSSRSGSMAPSLSQQEERGPQRRPDLSSPHAAVRPP